MSGVRYERVALVGGHRGDDVGAAHRLGRTRTNPDLEIGHRQSLEIALELGGGFGIGVIQPQFANPQHAVECDGLKLALRPVTDERHGSAVRPRQASRRQGRNRGRAQGRDEGHLREQQRIAGGHVGEHAERGDGEKPLGRVLRMTVDVLERIQPPIAGRHQFDDAHLRMAGVARRLVEFAPAPVVRIDFSGQRLHEPRGPHLGHQLAYPTSPDVIHHGVLSLSVQSQIPRPVVSRRPALVNSQKNEQNARIIDQIDQYI